MEKEKARKINQIPQILEAELAEIIKKIAQENNISPYVKNPDFLEERVYPWHQFGLFSHTKRVREIFRQEMSKILKNWQIANKVNSVLNEEIDGINKKTLIEISIPLHDLGKILVYGDTRTNREHELVSEKLIYEDFLNNKLKKLGLSEKQIGYIAMCIKTHNVLGKQLRDILKHKGKLKLNYISKNKEEIKNLCKQITEEYPYIKTEIGIFFLCDLLGKTDIIIEMENDEERTEKEQEIEALIKEKNLNPELKKTIIQFPVSLKLVEIYLRNL